MKISREKINADQHIEISVDIENIGAYAGDEVVQIYLRDLYASMVRPVKELAGFKRLKLSPGEKKCVVFEISASQMAFLDEDMHWKIEKGGVQVEIGSSSEDIRQIGTFFVNNNAWIKGKEREFYAKSFVKEVF